MCIIKTIYKRWFYFFEYKKRHSIECQYSIALAYRIGDVPQIHIEMVCKEETIFIFNVTSTWGKCKLIIYIRKI
ncbi:hypothetical protein CN971_02195 [Bacillus thuringiensis]|uniref:Uncharacterized protein n=1 Tax=Bacillus thuringiensis TaxID=1428 RepID=A0A9X7BJD7_BACTU|nr:hypothetical protein COM82_20145 [Bacillus thuringiensis]PED23586.1 hypothetical protein CON34_25040 [Bacillus thuringiensis]PFL10940.1 hypothetical protein COJ28_04000 [Bacillus thuringiensis]PFV25849.1 hypothetical protein COK99_28950 [Bacillus thuringiensis]PGN24403.1 hypothetical protein CN969_12605 [Bacillus thuringiensis]